MRTAETTGATPLRAQRDRVVAARPALLREAQPVRAVAAPGAGLEALDDLLAALDRHGHLGRVEQPVGDAQRTPGRAAEHRPLELERGQQAARVASEVVRALDEVAVGGALEDDASGACSALRTTSGIVSTAMRLAVSPPLCPPMPSATTKRPSSGAVMRLSWFCWRLRPMSVC